MYVVPTFDLPHGYWMPMTLALVLSSVAGVTRAKAAQRIVGTIGGGVLAGLLALLLERYGDPASADRAAGLA